MSKRDGWALSRDPKRGCGPCWGPEDSRKGLAEAELSTGLKGWRCPHPTFADSLQGREGVETLGQEGAEQVRKQKGDGPCCRAGHCPHAVPPGVAVKESYEWSFSLSATARPVQASVCLAAPPLS